MDVVGEGREIAAFGWSFLGVGGIISCMVGSGVSGLLKRLCCYFAGGRCRYAG